ncbi:MAG: fructose-6-phosphate aldolase [Bacilli bacterium]|jgi:transaldolase|nr:fructose-6-phosphate aldolase [Bacilli bacterium]
MKLFIDTANIAEIKEIAQLGILSGVTTNPSLIAKEKRDFKEVVKEITTIVDGPISAEPVSEKAEEIIKEAEELVKIHDNIVIKLTATEEGLKACHILSKKGIKTNVTLVFSVNQALMASLAGATYVSPFIGRVDDINQDGIKLIEDIADVFTIHDIKTKIIAASIRNPLHVTNAALAGADIATVPTKVIKAMFKHPLTEDGIRRFREDWESVYQK